MNIKKEKISWVYSAPLSAQKHLLSSYMKDMIVFTYNCSCGAKYNELKEVKECVLSTTYCTYAKRCKFCDEQYFEHYESKNILHILSNYDAVMHYRTRFENRIFIVDVVASIPSDHSYTNAKIIFKNTL